MHASIVVLSALVAVSSAQFWAGMMPMNPYTGTPIDTPEVQGAKVFHAHAHANAAMRSGYLYRKRREAPAAESAAAEKPQEAPVEPAEHNQEKRYLGYLGYGYGYTPYMATPYVASPFLWRKKRDTTEEAAVESADESLNRDKRYGYYGLGYGYGYSGYPLYRSAYTAPWGIWRKKRDLSAVETPAVESADESVTRDKRYYYGLGYGYGYSGLPIYRSAYGAPWGIWRKKRDLTEEEPQTQSAEESNKDKRQVMLGYGWGYPAFRSYYGGLYW